MTIKNLPFADPRRHFLAVAADFPSSDSFVDSPSFDACGSLHIRLPAVAGTPDLHHFDGATAGDKCAWGFRFVDVQHYFAATNEDDAILAE